MKKCLLTFGAGLLFAIGLGVAGMTLPERVIGFLDITGAWDPTLAFVMAGAIAVYMTLFRASRKHERPVLAPNFGLPTRRDIDVRLVVGAILFGTGWGLAGICPGPALTTAAGAPGLLAFLLTMSLGSLLPGLISKAKATQ